MSNPGIARIESIQVIVGAIAIIAAEQAASSDPSLVPLSESFDSLLTGFKEEYSSLLLDEVIVGAIGQVVCEFLWAKPCS